MQTRRRAHRRRKATSSTKARSAGRRATCGPRRFTTASTPSCACMPATPSSPTTGTRPRCLDHARNNFEGYTFAMRTLEAWGAMIESDQARLLHGRRADLGAGSGAVRPAKKRLPQTNMIVDVRRSAVLRLSVLRTTWQERSNSRRTPNDRASHSADRRHTRDRRAADLRAPRSRATTSTPPASPTPVTELVAEQHADALVLDCSVFDMSESLFDTVRGPSGSGRAADRHRQRHSGKADASLRARQAQHVHADPEAVHRRAQIARALGELLVKEHVGPLSRTVRSG